MPLPRIELNISVGLFHTTLIDTSGMTHVVSKLSKTQMRKYIRLLILFYN